jgi:hypothetical protein
MIIDTFINFFKLPSFVLGTSLVNFCEVDNYHSLFVEFYNTVSSSSFIFFGLYGIYKLYNNTNPDTASSSTGYNFADTLENNKVKLQKIYNIQINLYIILIIIGIFSIYFHATMSEFAHFVDIISISFILLLSMYYLEVITENNNVYKNSKYIIMTLMHLLTCLLIPHIHIFLLIIIGFNIKKKLTRIIDDSPKKLVSKISLTNDFKFIKKLFLITLFIWSLDYFGCNYLYGYHLHFIFHILISYISYNVIHLIKYIL